MINSKIDWRQDGMFEEQRYYGYWSSDKSLKCYKLVVGNKISVAMCQNA